MAPTRSSAPQGARNGLRRAKTRAVPTDRKCERVGIRGYMHGWSEMRGETTLWDRHQVVPFLTPFSLFVVLSHCFHCCNFGGCTFRSQLSPHCAPPHKRQLVWPVRPGLPIVAVRLGPRLAAAAPGQHVPSRRRLGQLRGRARQVRLLTAASVVTPVAFAGFFFQRHPPLRPGAVRRHHEDYVGQRRVAWIYYPGPAAAVGDDTACDEVQPQAGKNLHSTNRGLSRAHHQGARCRRASSNSVRW